MNQPIQVEVNLRIPELIFWLRHFDEKLDAILRKGNVMAGELDTLITDVAKNADVEASAAQTLDTIKAKLDAAGTDPAKLAALSQTLGASRDALAAAIARDTPPDDSAAAAATVSP